MSVTMLPSFYPQDRFRPKDDAGLNERQAQLCVGSGMSEYLSLRVLFVFTKALFLHLACTFTAYCAAQFDCVFLEYPKQLRK